MEFIPRAARAAGPAGAVAQDVAAAPAPLDGRQRAIREIGVAAVAAALGLAEGAPAHAETLVAMPLSKAA